MEFMNMFWIAIAGPTAIANSTTSDAANFEPRPQIAHVRTSNIAGDVNVSTTTRKSS